MTSAGARAAESLTAEQITSLPTYNWEIAQVGDSGTAVHLRRDRGQHRRLLQGDPQREPPVCGRGSREGRPVRRDRRAAGVRVQVLAAAAQRGHARAGLRLSGGEGRVSDAVRQGRAVPASADPPRATRSPRSSRSKRSTSARQHVHHLAGPGTGCPGRADARVHLHDHLAAGAARTERAGGTAPRPDRISRCPSRRRTPCRSIVKLESQEAIDRYSELTRVRPRVGANLHTDEEFARRTIFGGTANMGVATLAYCSEVLEQEYGPSAMLRPGTPPRVQGDPPDPGRPRDHAERPGERARPGGQECEIRVVNQDGVLVGIATATVIPD